MGGAKLVRIPVKVDLHRVVFSVKNNVGSSGKFGTIRVNNPSNKYLMRSRLSDGVSFSSLSGVNTVVNSNKLIIVSRSAYVMRITEFFVGFARERDYKGYIPYERKAGHVLRVLRHVIIKGKRVDSLSRLRRLTSVVRGATLYNLKGDTPGPIMDAVRTFQGRCRRRVMSGGYHTKIYSGLHIFGVSPRGYGKYSGYTGGYPMGTVAKGVGSPFAVSRSGYVGYKDYVSGYPFKTICAR